MLLIYAIWFARRAPEASARPVGRAVSPLGSCSVLHDRQPSAQMGATHFLTRKLTGVSAEMSLNVLAYNLKRVMKIVGANGLMKALSA